MSSKVKVPSRVFSLLNGERAPKSKFTYSATKLWTDLGSSCNPDYTKPKRSPQLSCSVIAGSHANEPPSTPCAPLNTQTCASSVVWREEQTIIYSFQCNNKLWFVLNQKSLIDSKCLRREGPSYKDRFLWHDAKPGFSNQS